MNDLSVFIPVSKASPNLFLTCANGLTIKSALLTVRKPGAGSEYYLRWKLSDVLITSYGIAFNPGDQKPVDHITLRFSKIEIEYKETGQSPVTAGWDVATSRAT